jgi:enterobactin synthetase component D / holo-[acyl-carrier protein] synthase
MLEELVPPEVVVVESFGDIPDVVLFPEEEAALGRAVEKRRREFATVRSCARQAMARLGLPPAPIVPGERGAPGWAAGLVGSMTHCDGYRASALSRAADVVAVGVDAEVSGPLPRGVLDLISLPSEHEMLSSLASAPGTSWDRLLFSAKEAVYKAWFPITGRWLSFEDAIVAIAPADGTFTARLLVPGPVVNGRPLREFSGRWIARDGLILTAIVIARTC